MIINIRGTHGSGKTTIARKVMAQFPKPKPIYVEGRTAPIGYHCGERLFVAGSYENVSGGCDTIPKVDVIYKIIRRYAKRGFDVLFEGILAQHSTPSILKLHDRGYDVAVVAIDIPVEKAIRGVLARRKARGDTRPFNPANVVKEDRYTILAALRLRDEGVQVWFPKTRARALHRTLSLLDIR